MMEALLTPIISASVFVIIYAVLVRGLLRATEPLRVSVFAMAEDLLRRSDLSEDDRQEIELTLNELYSSFAAWSYAFRALRLLILLPYTYLRTKDRKDLECDNLPFRFHVRSLIAILGNSPGALFVTTTSVILLSAFCTWFDVVGKLISGHRDHDHEGNGHHPVRA